MALVTLDGGQSASAINGQSVDFIVNKVLMEGPAAPDTLVRSKTLDVIRDFYTNSGALREQIGPYNLGVGQETLYLNPIDQYTQMQYVLQAWLFPTTPGGTQKQFMKPTTRQIQTNNLDGPLPTWYWMSDPTTMHLYPIPQTNLGKILWVYGIVMPLTNTGAMPLISTTHHLDALMWGTLARLFAMPKKPWTDMTLAAQFKRDYRREMLRWRDVANRSYTNTTPQWRYPNFAGRNNHGTSVWGVRG